MMESEAVMSETTRETSKSFVNNIKELIYSLTVFKKIIVSDEAMTHAIQLVPVCPMPHVCPYVKCYTCARMSHATRVPAATRVSNSTRDARVSHALDATCVLLCHMPHIWSRVTS